MPVLQHLGLSVPFDSQHKLVTSPFFKPTVLACIRLVIAVYIFFTLLFILIWEIVREHDASSYFSYFTELSNIGLCAYYWAAFTQTALYLANGSKRYALQKWPRFLQFLHLFLQATVLNFPILVSIVYWVLLASSSTFATKYSAWSEVSLHALNTVFALFEILLTNNPPIYWPYLISNILALAGYLGVAYITHITQGFYTYDFLDPTTHPKTLPAYIVGIAVAEVILFVIVHFVMVGRQRLAVKKGWLLVEDNDRAVTPLEEWEDIDRPKTPMAL